MSGKFSAFLQLTDLNDFIGPSQECIKPLQTKKSDIDARVRIKNPDKHEHVAQVSTEKLEKVQITLNDCLACSGCITSAEGVLISQQNFEEIFKFLNKDGAIKNKDIKLVIVSLSVQPILSLSQKYGISPDDAAKCLSSLFKDLGADLVVEMSLAEDFALLESQNEFLQRYNDRVTKNVSIPMLSSSCPGWICYAEKVHGKFILPYVSTTKSPQQIMGSLVKYNLGYAPNEVYHITLMPCYDKKLEAARTEFFSESANSKDVDCVVTTVEVEQLLQEKNILLNELPRANLDYPWGRYNDGVIFGHFGSGSGGYAHNVLIHAAREILGLEVKDINWKVGKNSDLKEVTIERQDLGLHLRFAVVNGFRNIQNIVQKIKRGKNMYDYIEIMACPSGCLNGGAQIKSVDGNSHPRNIVNGLEGLYENVVHYYPHENGIVENLYEKWLDGIGSDKCFTFLHTIYRPTEKSSFALNIKW